MFKRKSESTSISVYDHYLRYYIPMYIKAAAAAKAQIDKQLTDYRVL